LQRGDGLVEGLWFSSKFVAGAMMEADERADIRGNRAADWPVQEADLIVSFFTRDYGRVKAWRRRR